jgi:glutathione S-transferase
MEYVEPRDAADMSGLRLVLTVGVPGPWGEAAKNIFEYKGIDYVPVAQHASRANEDLLAWTGIRNAPIAVYEDEPPRANFMDIVMLAERLKPELRLIPDDPAERMLCFGISTEICAERGFGWRRRHIMSRASRKPTADTSEVADPKLDRDVMQRAYGGNQREIDESPAYLAHMLDAFADRLRSQRAAGSDYFVGTSVTACDIHWACFSALLDPLPHDVNPMPAWLRVPYSYLGEELEAHKHIELIEHRDMMFQRHLRLPLDF